MVRAGVGRMLHPTLGLAMIMLALTAGPITVIATVLECNSTLAPGSTLTLTEKLDLSGRGSAPSVPWPCGIYGPSSLPAATIVLPTSDCVLHAQGLVTLTGNLRFIVGKKSNPKQFDCCGDGEGHGSILCSDSNLTVSQGAVVSVETTDDTVEISPGGFWTGEWITVDGIVNASLLPGQMTGVNGLLSSSGIRIGFTAQVIASGQAIARGAAVQGGDYGTVIDGTISCSSYTAADSGGCVAAGKFLAVGKTGVIHASNATCEVAGCSVSGSDMVTTPFEGRIEVQNMNCTDAGAIMCADNLIMSGDSSIVARNINSTGGPAITMTNLTLRDRAQITVSNSWGGDGGAIGTTLVTMSDNSAVFCENSYADNCGGCILANMNFSGNASIVARNTVGGALGGALCGGYPGQNLVVRDTVNIDVTVSNSKLYGGAIMAHDITLGPGAFAIRIRNSTAQCGAAIATLNGNDWGKGTATVDTSGGGVLLIEDVYEGIPGLDCKNIHAVLKASNGTSIPQPCSGCGAPFFPPAQRPQCTCALQKPSAVRECCTGF